MFNKLNTNTWKILQVFFENPSQDYNVREIGRILKIAPATASKELSRLANYGVLKKRDMRMLKLFQADLESDLFKDIKKFHDTRKLKDSGLISELIRAYAPSAVVLSEDELVVISSKKKKFSIKKFENKINKELKISIINLRELKDRRILNKVLNGDVIFGEVKWN